MVASTADNKNAINELFSASNQHGRDIAVLHQENGELKAGQQRLEGAMASHGELLHTIKADLQVNRFPGIAPIAQMTALVGTIVAMVVAAISYISANFVGSSLGPKIIALEKQNIIMEYRLAKAEPTIARLAQLEKQISLHTYRIGEVEKFPRLMFRSSMLN